MNNRNILPKLLLIATLVALLPVWSCESKLFYTEPIKYPKKFAFTGRVYSQDSLPLENIRIVLFTPADLDSSMVYTDPQGHYYFIREMEFVGPNKMKVRDVDGNSHGGKFQGIDTTFNLTELHWDSLRVRQNFYLKPL